MPTPLRRRGSGLLQNPRPGMLPSPVSPRLDPLGPLRDRFSTRQSSGSLRPAALFHLPSAPPLSGHRRFHYRAPLAAYPGRTFTGWSPRPSWAVRDTILHGLGYTGLVASLILVLRVVLAVARDR